MNATFTATDTVTGLSGSLTVQMPVVTPKPSLEAIQRYVEKRFRDVNPGRNGEETSDGSS